MTHRTIIEYQRCNHFWYAAAENVCTCDTMIANADTVNMTVRKRIAE